jgi:diguanylate cyclase (GGDEF)-like protein
MFKVLKQVDISIRELIADESSDSIFAYQESVLNLTFKIYIVSFLVAFIASISRIVDIGWQPFITIQSLLFLLLITVNLLRHKLSFRFRASFLSLLFFILGVVGLSTFGVASPYTATFGISILVAIIFLGIKAGLFAGIACIIFQLGLEIVLLYNDSWFEVDFNAYIASPTTWITQTTSFIAIVMVTILGVGWLYKMLEVSLDLLKNNNIELQHAKAELALLVLTDPLTKLPNRRQLFERLQSELERYKRSGSKFCVMMIDLDFFKKINDTYGHPAGDAVLEAFGKMALSSIRKSELIARYGGEEFVVVLPETELPIALKAAERLQHSLESMKIPFNSHTLNVTASIGVTIVTDDDQSIETIIKRADSAVYIAKENGRNRVEVQ